MSRSPYDEGVTLDRCCAMGVDFTPEVMRLEKPHRELKWEIPVETSGYIAKEVNMRAVEEGGTRKSQLK